MRDIRPRRESEKPVPVAKVHVPRTAEPFQVTPKPSPPLFYKRQIGPEKTTKLVRRVGLRERYILLALFGVGLTIAGLALIIFLPTAKIELTLRTAPLLVEQVVKLDASSSRGREATTIPSATFFRELESKGEVPVASTEVIGSKAKGTVSIVNRSIEEQAILEKSRLITKDGQLFYLTQAIRVPANGRITGAIEAAEAGTEGNIEPQRLNFAALDEVSQRLVYGEVTSTLTSGSGETVSVVRENDLEEARRLAQERARETARQEIQSELPEGWAILEEAWSTEIEALKMAEVGERIPVLTYEGRITVRTLGYDQMIFDEQLKKALEEKLEAGFMLFPEPLSYTRSAREVDWQAGRAEVAARVTHTTIPELALDSLREKIAGRHREEVISYLEGLPGVRAAEVELSPFWVKRIPRLERRIKIQVESDQII
jgi:hypothetical protein